MWLLSSSCSTRRSVLLFMRTDGCRTSRSQDKRSHRCFTCPLFGCSLFIAGKQEAMEATLVALEVVGEPLMSFSRTLLQICAYAGIDVFCLLDSRVVLFLTCMANGLRLSGCICQCRCGAVHIASNVQNGLTFKFVKFEMWQVSLFNQCHYLPSCCLFWVSDWLHPVLNAVWLVAYAGCCPPV